jgi:hypothetical protein
MAYDGGREMADIRDRVEEDRGLLKKIQLVIPGFSGYRSKEDLRAADSMLRIQLADRLRQNRDGMEECRRVMVEGMMTDLLENVGGLINKFQATEGKVRHAEQGYSGISADIRINEEDLERIYDYDYSMIMYVLEIEKAVVSLRKAIDYKDAKEMKTSVDVIRTRLADFDRTFEERIERVAGIFNF